MSSRSVAFFGATGGCVNACLALTLENGHQAMALVRNPEKLKTQLISRGIPQNTIESQLKMVEGDVRDASVVEKVLQINGQGVDAVISGIGGVPQPQISLFKPLTMTDPTICGDATQSIVEAMKGSKLLSSPPLVVISANGVSDTGPRDYPLALTPLYRWMLRGVYDDKRRMEDVLAQSQLPGGYLILRPSVLSDGPGKGTAAVRQGQDIMGWGIAREDVGAWLYENVVEKEVLPSMMSTAVSISY